MVTSRIPRDRRPAPVLVVTCLLAAFSSRAAGGAAASPTDTQAVAQEPAQPVSKAGLLPPAIVLFEDRAGAGLEPVPDAEGSSAAADAVSAAFVAEMAARKIELTVIGKEEIGPVDLSTLYGIPGRIARGDTRPFPEAALSVEYPPGSVDKVMERHRLDAVWIVTGVAILSRRSAETSGPATSPKEAPGNRLLLRAALVDRKGTVLFSEVVDEGAVGQGERLPGSLAEYRTKDVKREAEQAAARALDVKAAEPRSPHPAEFRLGFGVFFFAGVDLWAGFLPKNSRWQFGYRYVRWTDNFEDPYTGNDLTESRQEMQGPQMNYLFRPQKRGTWYLGASVLRWSRTETASMNGVSDSDSVVTLYFGGGYTRHLGKHFYCNAAMFISPGAQLETNTGVSGEESSGGFDIQLQIGASF